MRNRRRNKDVKPRTTTDEMTLGQPRVRLTGQSAFLRNSGGGPCSGCGTPYDTLFADGKGPCCHRVGPQGDGSGPATVKRSS